jgi:hypothetical protein
VRVCGSEGVWEGISYTLLSERNTHCTIHHTPYTMPFNKYTLYYTPYTVHRIFRMYSSSSSDESVGIQYSSDESVYIQYSSDESVYIQYISDKSVYIQYISDKISVHTPHLSNV